MSVFAISDLHLSTASAKPMDVFGPAWDRHAERLAGEWAAAVAAGDTVLLPGDISWAMRLEDAAPDFAFLEALPGWKIISKGNHDYWWTTLKKMRAFIQGHGFRSISFVHNGAAACEGGGAVVAAARGWICPGAPGFGSGGADGADGAGDAGGEGGADGAGGADGGGGAGGAGGSDGVNALCSDERLYAREAGRLARSLADARALAASAGAPKLVAMLHFPPFCRNPAQGGAGMADECAGTAFMEEIEKHRPDICVYGHLHGDAARGAFEGRIGATRFAFVAADHLGFRPQKLF